MAKLYRVFGFWESSVVCFGRPVVNFHPVPEMYFRTLHDAMLYVSAHCVGFWEIFCGTECVARSSVPEEM